MYHIKYIFNYGYLFKRLLLVEVVVVVTKMSPPSKISCGDQKVTR